MRGMKLELSHAERNTLLDAAGRDKIASAAGAMLEQARTAGLTHLQTIALVDYIRLWLETPPDFGGFENKAG